MQDRYLLIISNPQQAAFRLRWSTIMPALAHRGINFDIEIRPNGAMARYKLARKAGQYAGVIVQRKLLEPWEARVLRKSAKRLLFDVDDAVMFKSTRPNLFSAWRQRRRFQATARALDLAVVGNEYLKGQFESAGCRDCRILPTTLDAHRYHVKKHEHSPVLQLVWIGSKSTLPYLASLVPMLEVIHGHPHDLQLIIIADATIHSPNLPIRHIPWTEKTEISGLVQGDVGIAPTPNDDWAMGKCGFKILQYMASALPVVASPVGANTTIVRNGVTGFLASTTQEWSTAMARLGADPSIRQRMGDAGRQVVMQEYTLALAIDFWTKLLSDAKA